MFDLTSSGFWIELNKQLLRAVTWPGVEIQLYLAVLALAIAKLAAMLTQRLLARKLHPSKKFSWIADSLLPEMLFPLLSVLLLIVAHWIATVTIPFKPAVIAGVIKIAMVCLIARGLLLIAQRHFIAYFVSGVMLVLVLLSVTNLLAPAQASLNEITFETSTFRLSLLGAIKGIFTLVVLFWGAGVLSHTGENWLRRMQMAFNARELAIKFLRIFLYFTAFVLTLNEMGVDLTALTVFGGALAVGLGFGLQKITSNFISGIILLFEKTIQANDLIEVGGEKGWVRRMEIRHTQIETADGRDILIPNEDLITGKVTNWTYTNTRARIDIVLSVVFDSDIDLVQKLMLQAARDFPTCISDPPPACLLKEFTDHGIQMQIVFWIPDLKTGMGAAKSDVMLRIIHAFRQNNVSFAKA